MAPPRRLARMKQLLRAYHIHQRARKASLTRRTIVLRRHASALKAELGQQRFSLGELSDISSAPSGSTSGTDDSLRDDGGLGSQGTSLYDLSDTESRSSSSAGTVDSHGEALDHMSLDVLSDSDSNDEILEDLSDGDADDEGESEDDDLSRKRLSTGRWVRAGVSLPMDSSDCQSPGARAG
jgi:hypothetical protein